jgi:signal transduction histidine kinase
MRQKIARFGRLRVRGFPAPDLLLAAALCVIAVVSVLAGAPDEGPIALTLPVAVVTTAAVSWRRRGPLVAASLVVLAGMVQTLVSQSPDSLWSLVVYVIVVYSVAAYCTEGVAALAGAVIVAALLIEERIDSGVDYVFIVLLFGGVWLLGRASRHWRRRVTVAEQHQRESARLAVAEERVKIARDLHDVIAHSLSVITVQSDAAEAALINAPERALEPVRTIRATARESLTEIRRMLDVLRTDDLDRPGVRSPGISAISGLVDAARASGTPIDLVSHVTTDPIPAETDLAVYRIVQECLTNARRHAPGAATLVEIAQTEGSLALTVRNSPPATAPPPSPGTGYGLRGVQERARALGGVAHAERLDDGSFVVHALLPLTTGHSVRSTP